MSFSYYAIGAMRPTPTGTLDTASGTTITGGGTAFLTELQAGDVVLLHRAAGDEGRVVRSVTNDGEAEVYGASLSAIVSGTTYDIVRFTNVEDLIAGLPAPRSLPKPYTKEYDLANASRLGAGWRTSTWTWDFLRAEHYNVLQAYIETAYGLSYTGYVRTNAFYYTSTQSYDPNLAFQYYSGVAVFPSQPNPDMRRFKQYQVTWRKLQRIVVPFATPA